jgi:hypothetical protein
MTFLEQKRFRDGSAIEMTIVPGHTKTVRIIDFGTDGVSCFWPDVVNLVRHLPNSWNLRYWQATHLMLSELKQIGLPDPWPGVFYHEGWAPPKEFWAHFEEIDHFLMPRDFDSSVPAIV